MLTLLPAPTVLPNFQKFDSGHRGFFFLLVTEPNQEESLGAKMRDFFFPQILTEKYQKALILHLNNNNNKNSFMIL